MGKRATAMERYAAKELQRYLHAVFGVYGTLADDAAPLDRPSCLVGRPESNARIAALVVNKTLHLAQGDPGAGGYVLKTVRVAGQPVLVVAGGDEVRVVETQQAVFTGWDVYDRGLCYFDARPDGTRVLRVYDFASGRARDLAEIPKLDNAGLAVSPDGRWVVYDQQDAYGSDLVLVENFR